jgi:hypothetical protein
VNTTVAPRAPLSADEAAAYARMALACVHRAYPYQVQHELDGDEDVAAPRRAHPVFWGCYDWHSAVHGHWTIAAVARRFPRAAIADDARAALARSFTAAAIAGEDAWLARRPLFERPYGLAWLCALHAELAAWDEGAAWAARLAPMAHRARARIVAWLERLSHPTRVGTHAQSAFAAALVIDAARTTGDDDVAARVSAAGVRLHGGDRGPALHLEPSGEDFLSPALGAAAVMARALPAGELAAWLARALPELDDDAAVRALAPPVPADRADGRLVHLDGLCASRATMLATIARALPAGDRRRGSLAALADAHADAALAALAAQGYQGAHWLGTFALAMRLALTAA